MSKEGTITATVPRHGKRKGLGYSRATLRADTQYAPERVEAITDLIAESVVNNPSTNCALDLDGASYEEIGVAMGLSRERVRQLETSGKRRMKKTMAKRLNPSIDEMARDAYRSAGADGFVALFRRMLRCYHFNVARVGRYYFHNGSIVLEDWDIQRA